MALGHTMKTEGGCGGKRGHSNMSHREHTAVIKEATRKLRRQTDKKLAKEFGKSGMNKFTDDTFDYKGYGRILVKAEEDVQKVKDILKQQDEFEFGYFRDEIVCVKGKVNGTVYIGKFQPDLQGLIRACNEAGIEIEILSAFDVDD